MFKKFKASEARLLFQDIIDSVYYKEDEIIITKRGKPWVAIRPLTEKEKEMYKKV
jgi:prevent-host-death family protein